MTVVTDTFTGTDATLLTAHTGETGATWTQHSASTGTIQIRTNRVRNSAALVGKYLASGTPAAADYEVQADFVLVSDNGSSTMGLLGRYDASTDNGYLLRYLTNGTPDGYQLLKVVAGVGTSLAQAATAISGGSDTVILRFIGSTIQVWVDGVRQINVVDTTFASAGKAGVYGAGTSGDAVGVHLDNFSVNDSISVAGSIASTSSLTGALAVTAAAAGSISSTSTLTGALTDRAGLAGTVASTSTLTGAVTARAGLTGSIAATSSLTGDLTNTTTLTPIDLAGTIAATSSMSGTLDSLVPAPRTRSSRSTGSGRPTVTASSPTRRRSALTALPLSWSLTSSRSVATTAPA